MDSVYNNTFVPLNAGQSWEGKSESISKFTVASVSCITDTSGTLHLYFSLNNNNFDFIKTYTLRPNEPFIINQKVEGKWFKAKVINNSGINQTYLRLTTTYKEDIRSDLDIRPLHSEKDTISIPALNECIVDGKLVVSVESVTVSGVTVDISGQTVNIDGQMVKSRLYDSNGYAFGSQLADGSRALTTYNLAGIRAKEGTTVKEVNAVTDANHGGTNLCVYDDVLNDKINNVNIAGEDLGAIKVFVSNTAAQKLNCAVNTITGFATETTADSILTQLEKNTYDSSGNIKVAGSVTVNTISGFATETTADSILTQLEKNTYDSSGNIKVAGSVTVNTISGFATETTADGILTQLEKNTYDSSGNLKIAGTVAVNTITGFATETTADSILTQLEKNTYDSSGNLKITGTVAVNTITGFATETTADGILTQLEKNTYDSSGNLKIAGTVTVNTISGFATETTADGILTQLEKNTYDSSGNLKIAGTVTVNTISGFATETTADSILTQLEKNTYDSSGNLKIAGSVTVNTISGFAVESGGNLADIKTNTGRIKSDTTYADAVQVAVKNTIDVSGNVNVNTISGFALENGGNLASIKTNTDKNNYDASGNLKVNLATGSITVSAVNIKDSSGNNIYADGSGNLKTNIQNSFLDVHNKVYHNSSWIDLVGASNGHLIVNSSTQDGAGTDITSTVVGSKTGLDVNIAGGSSTSLIKDSSGNGISAQVAGAAYAGYLNTYNPHLANATLDNSITTISKSLVQGSSPNVYLSNRCNSIGDQYVVLSTNGGGNTVAFDNTSNNNKVKIDPSNNTVSFASGQSVGITSSSNTVKIGDASNEVLTLSPTQHDATKIAADTNAHMVGYSRTDSGYNTATLVRPYTSNSTANSVRAVESYSYNVCLNNSSNLYLPVTSTTTDTTQSMDTFINNDSTINNYATTGLNMYQIYPKRKTYQLSGISSTGALNTMLSSFGTNTTFSAVSWGQTALKTFYASMGAGGTTKYLRFEYVDSNGDLQTTGTVGVGTGSGTTPLFVSVVGINRIYFASAAQSGANNQAFGTADGLYVSTTSGSTAPSYYGGFYYANWNSTYTCPNFKVAILKNFTFYASSGSDVYAFVCDSTGGRRMLLQVINASNFIYQVVDLQINPGETLFFGTGNSTTPLNKQVFAQIYQYDV